MRGVATFLLTAWPVAIAAAEEPPALSNNPFARPPSEVLREISASSGRSEIMDTELELHATLVGSVNRLANVGDRVLKPGDEINGHVLVAVFERYAVFERDGRNVTIYVKPELAESDE